MARTLIGARAIKLLRDRSYAQRVGQAAREKALTMLNPAALNAHERTEYAKLLGLTKRQRPSRH